MIEKDATDEFLLGADMASLSHPQGSATNFYYHNNDDNDNDDDDNDDENDDQQETSFKSVTRLKSADKHRWKKSYFSPQTHV